MRGVDNLINVPNRGYLIGQLILQGRLELSQYCNKRRFYIFSSGLSRFDIDVKGSIRPFAVEIANILFNGRRFTRLSRGVKDEVLPVIDQGIDLVPIEPPWDKVMSLRVNRACNTKFS